MNKPLPTLHWRWSDNTEYLYSGTVSGNPPLHFKGAAFPYYNSWTREGDVIVVDCINLSHLLDNPTFQQNKQHYIEICQNFKELNND